MIRIYAAIALLIALIDGGWMLHHRGYVSGVAMGDAKIAAMQAADAAALAKAKDQAAAHYIGLTNDFDTISTTYEAATHAPLPSLAGDTATAVSDGSVRLRNNPVCPAGIATSATTASARAADAAATQALADRVADSIAAVRAGDDADARERQLGAQMTGLQAIVRADRSGQ